MSWFYLFIASCFEVLWTYSLKALSVQKIRELDWAHFFASRVGLYTLLPLIGYVGFGVGNVTFFSMAMRQIPAATAYAAWMAMALIGLKLVDVLYYKEAYSLPQLFFISLIIIGVLGLRRTP